MVTWIGRRSALTAYGVLLHSTQTHSVEASRHADQAAALGAPVHPFLQPRALPEGRTPAQAPALSGGTKVRELWPTPLPKEPEEQHCGFAWGSLRRAQRAAAAAGGLAWPVPLGSALRARVARAAWGGLVDVTATDAPAAVETDPPRPDDAARVAELYPDAPAAAIAHVRSRR